MNPDPLTMTDSNTATEPDYKVAAAELAALFTALGITAEVTGLHAAIDKDDGREWPHVACTVTFTRPAMDNGNGRTMNKPASFATPWKMGVGLVKWAEIAKRSSNRFSDLRSLLNYAARHANLSSQSWLSLCSAHLADFRKVVNPAEVLANVCRDFRDAETTFADWASSFGYSEDSRRAESIYFECQRLGTEARKLLTRAEMEKLADLACRL